MKREKASFVCTGLGDGCLRARFDGLFPAKPPAGGPLVTNPLRMVWASSEQSDAVRWNGIYRGAREDGLTPFLPCTDAHEFAPVQAPILSYLSLKDRKNLEATSYGRAIYADAKVIQCRHTRLQDMCFQLQFRSAGIDPEAIVTRIRRLLDEISSVSFRDDGPIEARFLTAATEAIGLALSTTEAALEDLMKKNNNAMHPVAILSAALIDYVQFPNVVMAFLILFIILLAPRPTVTPKIDIILDNDILPALVAVVNFHVTGDPRLAQFAIIVLGLLVNPPDFLYGPVPFDLGRCETVYTAFITHGGHDAVEALLKAQKDSLPFATLNIIAGIFEVNGIDPGDLFPSSFS